MVLLHVLGICGVGGKLIKAMTSMHMGAKAGAWVNSSMSRCFELKMGLMQGCVMLLWLFIIILVVELCVKQKPGHWETEDH